MSQYRVIPDPDEDDFDEEVVEYHDPYEEVEEQIVDAWYEEAERLAEGEELDEEFEDDPSDDSTEAKMRRMFADLSRASAQKYKEEIVGEKDGKPVHKVVIK